MLSILAYDYRDALVKLHIILKSDLWIIVSYNKVVVKKVEMSML